MLIIDLRRLAQAPVEVSGAIASDDPAWEGSGLQLAAPLAARARAEGNVTHGVWIRGAFEARVEASCRRCLKPLELEISEVFEWLFDPKASDAESDEGLYVLDPRAEEIDLHVPLRERLLLSVPAFPACGERCSSLCSHCGAKLIEGECSCRTEEADPRWAPLQALRKEQRETSVE